MFVCSQCGECCRHLNNSELYKQLDRGDGVCKYLEGDKCSIYENRPLLCNVEKSYFVFFKEQYSLEEYYQLNYRACDKLKSIKESD